MYLTLFLPLMMSYTPVLFAEKHKVLWGFFAEEF